MYFIFDGTVYRYDDLTPKERLGMKLNAKKLVAGSVDKVFTRSLNSELEEDNGKAVGLAVAFVADIEATLAAHPEACFMVNRFKDSWQISLRLNKKVEWENAQGDNLLDLLEKACD